MKGFMKKDTFSRSGVCTGIHHVPGSGICGHTAGNTGKDSRDR